MAALCNRAGHYIFALWFLLLSFFPRLISAVADWMSTILSTHGVALVRILRCRSETWCTQLAKSTGRKKFAIWAPLHGHYARQPICLQLRHVSKIGKNLLDSNISPACPHNMVNFGPLVADRLGCLGHPSNFQRVSLLHGIQAVGTSQTLQRWTEGTTYVRQGDHHVGPWPHCSYLRNLLLQTHSRFGQIPQISG